MFASTVSGVVAMHPQDSIVLTNKIVDRLAVHLQYEFLFLVQPSAGVPRRKHWSRPVVLCEKLHQLLFIRILLRTHVEAGTTQIPPAFRFRITMFGVSTGRKYAQEAD